VTRDAIGAFLDGLAASATPDAPPYIGIDESANSPVLFDAIGQLCNRNLASAAGPLWNERRVRSDGSILYMVGGKSRGLPPSEFLGKPARYARWDDKKVVSWLVAHFHSHDRLVLLSENGRLDPGGLCWLLQKNVGPVLAERHRNRFSLTVLFKTGKSTSPSTQRGSESSSSSGSLNLAMPNGCSSPAPPSERGKLAILAGAARTPS
jgi:hypothetical protein